MRRTGASSDRSAIGAHRLETRAWGQSRILPLCACASLPQAVPMHCIALRRAVLASVCFGLLATRSGAREDSNEIERWVPAAALSFDILGQRSDGAVESDNFTGPPISDGGCQTSLTGARTPGPCREPVPSAPALTPNVQGTDTTTAALVKLSLELMTPRLVVELGSPRLFAHADGSLAFAFRRKLAGAGKPGAMGLPPPPTAIDAPTQTNLSEDTILGQGNRAFSELQTG